MRPPQGHLRNYCRFWDHRPSCSQFTPLGQADAKEASGKRTRYLGTEGMPQRPRVGKGVCYSGKGRWKGGKASHYPKHTCPMVPGLYPEQTCPFGKPAIFSRCTCYFQGWHFPPNWLDQGSWEGVPTPHAFPHFPQGHYSWL